MKTSLDTKSSQWTYQHQEETQRQDIKNPMEEDKWMWTQNLEDACEEKPDGPAQSNHQFHLQTQVLILHNT